MTSTEPREVDALTLDASDTEEAVRSDAVDSEVTDPESERPKRSGATSVLGAFRDGARLMSESRRWTLGTIMVLHFIALVIFVTPIDAPTVYPDEFAYVAIARDFAGNYPETQFVALVYQFGYGAMMAPLARLFDTAYGFHAAAQWLNIALAVAVGPMLYSLVRRVFDLTNAQAGAAAALGVLAPATMVQPALLWAESAFTFTTVAAMLSLVRFAERSTPTRGMLLAATLAWAYAVHPRGIVLSIAVLLVLISLGARRKVTMPALLTTVGGLFALIYTVRRVQAGVAERVFGTGSLPLEAESELDLILTQAIPNADRWLRGLVGAVWYQGLVTVGLVVVVAWWAIKSVKTHVRDPNPASTLAMALGLAWGAALVVGALVFLGAERRIDHAVYGRYAGHLTPMLLAIGAALVLQNPSAQAQVLRFAAPMVAVGAVATRLAHPWGFWAGSFAFPNATVFGSLGDVVGLREPLRVGLASSVILVVFVLLLKRKGSVALLLPAACLGAVAYASTVTEIDPRSEWSERNFAFMSQFASTETIGEVVIGEDIEVFITRYGVQYWRPDLEFVNEEDATDESMYWMTGAERRRPVADARLVNANRSFNIRFWVRPGLIADEFELRNALYWHDIDLDVRVPSQAMRAELDTAALREIEIEAGESETVRIVVQHVGEDYPWPMGTSLIGDFSVRVGARWYLEDEEVATSRVDFARSVRPGEIRTVALELAALDIDGEPLEPGTYTVMVDVVQEFVAWFGDAGPTEPLELTVTVP